MADMTKVASYKARAAKALAKDGGVEVNLHSDGSGEFTIQPNRFSLSEVEEIVFGVLANANMLTAETVVCYPGQQIPLAPEVCAVLRQQMEDAAKAAEKKAAVPSVSSTPRPTNMPARPPAPAQRVVPLGPPAAGAAIPQSKAVPSVTQASSGHRTPPGIIRPGQARG